MSGGGGNTSTTTQNADPWAAAQPYLKDIMSGAKGLYGSGQGFSPYPGSTVVPFAGQTTDALGGIEGLARGGDALSGASRSQALGVLNSGGMSDWQKNAMGGAYDVATGANSLNAISSNLGATARGDYLGGRNPYFEANLDKQAGALAGDIQRSVDAMGRTGSGYNVNEIGEQVGNFRNQAMQQNYDSERQYQMQAAGLLGNEQAANIGNRIGAGQAVFSAGDTAAGRAAQYAGLSPAIYQSQFAPYERLASVGAQNEDLAGRTLQDQIDRYNGTQQAPWQRLGAYSSLVSGMGGQGGTTTQTAKAPSNYAAPLGGALAGAQLGSMFGPLGTGIGAVGGGLLGLFGV